MATQKTPFDKEVERNLRLIEQVLPTEYKEITQLLEQIDKIEVINKAKTEFLEFVKAMYPGWIMGQHHKIMAEIVTGVVKGEKKRIIVNLPPRHSKSELFTYLGAAYFLGHHPQKKLLIISATADMARGWSMKIRNLVATEEYQRIFPGTILRQDSKAAGRWHTHKGGEIFAVGAEGQVTGRGGDLILIDDPTGEQQAVAAMGDPSVYQKTYDWYVAGPRQRLQPQGCICVVQSRWAKNDFTGQLLEAERRADTPNVDHWEVVQLPAIMPSGNSLWPEFWSVDELERTRKALPPHRWLAQYMQDPSSDHAAILKRDWWKRWEYSEPPECFFKLITMDTAYSAKETADYSALITWGLFKHEKDGKVRTNIIMLHAWHERLDFPALKVATHKQYLKWTPDLFMVEAKASGLPLIYELRAKGVPISEYTPARGTTQSPNTKIVRANAVSDILASGIVWYPAGPMWAEEVIEECAGFPGNHDHDDYVDCVIMALMRLRQGGLIELATDNWDDEPAPYRRRHVYY